MEHILTGPYNKPTNNSRRPPRGAYGNPRRWCYKAQPIWNSLRCARSLTGAPGGRAP
ncbi:MAG: hypothetical protein ACMX3H_12670 [Sodalis sp. (in: enterobacteria)]|uniref:hypothetical protein n=1 Tax=Sodalis sp. (in: enterobacteria) TaxID=1898979 RepID=UPI0039E37F91